MTKNEIIEELAKNKVVEEIAINTSKGSYPDLDDFINDIYLELLEKPEDKIQQLYQKNQIKFFISRMITNNLFSANSRYYYKYQLWNNKRTELKEFKTDDIIKLKKIIFYKLTEAERRIIILYAQEESLRKLGALLGISTASAWIEVNKIRKKIKGYYYGE